VAQCRTLALASRRVTIIYLNALATTLLWSHSKRQGAECQGKSSLTRWRGRSRGENGDGENADVNFESFGLQVCASFENFSYKSSLLI
jgi:hypothetical protein